MKETLTATEQRAVNAISAFRDQMGFPPTAQELAQLLGFSTPSSSRFVLKSLIRKGYISSQPRTPRAIRVLAGNNRPRRMTAGERLLNDRIAAMDSPTLVIYADRTKAGEYVGFTAYDAGAEIASEKQVEGC